MYDRLTLPRNPIHELIIQYSWIFLMSAALTYAPVFAPLKYAAISGAILSGYDPLLVFLASTGGATMGTMSLMVLNAYTDILIEKYKKAKEKWDTEDNILDQKKKVSRREYFKKWKHDVYEKLQVVNNIPTLFGLTIVGTYTVIPDILVIRLTQYRIGTALFILATFVGKSVTNFAIVFGVDWLQTLFN